MDIFWNRILFRPAHNTCEFWDQSNSLGMDHITNPAPPHLLGHDLHCCLDFDFLVVTEPLRGHPFDLLKRLQYAILLLFVSFEGTIFFLALFR